jgi:ribose-phosphate pyrophosphokinase
MSPLLLAMPGNERMAEALNALLQAQRGPATVRRFPDGESSVRIEADPRGREVVLVCTLDRPDEKLVPLLLLANAAREAGAASVGLVAPYLPYMRQDCRFRDGEATSARHVARWISAEVDWLVTVDPHLHRIRSLAEVYSVANRVAHAADAVAEWIRANLHQPLLLGPDEESAQWVADIAARVGAPHVVLTKTRHGDRDVTVSIPQVERWAGHSPVLVDDIASTARTMIETVRHVRDCGLADPVCIAVHAIFAGDALNELRKAGAARVISTDTVVHETNRISVARSIAAAIVELCGLRPGLPS